MKTILFSIVACTSLHAMVEVPDFAPHDPTQNFALPDGSHIEFTPEDFSGDDSARFITLCPPGAVRPSMAGAPPRHTRMNGDRQETRVAVELMPIELVIDNFQPIIAFDAYPESNRAFIVCRDDGTCTLINLENPAEHHYVTARIEHDAIRACYFVSENTVRIISQSNVYEWNFTAGRLALIGRPSHSPTFDASCITIVRRKGAGAGAAAPGAAVARGTTPRQPMGCWRMLMWVLFGKKIYGR